MNGDPKRSRLDQRRAPIHEALETFRKMRVVPFDVPGHKRGRGNPELTAFLGEQCVGVDVNSMKPLDNLCHPVSVIREAEELAAEAFGAANAFLMVGGTTSSVQSMVLTACKRGDEIILPRNVHRSVLNALVLCGAVPVYVNPEVDTQLGISLGMKREQVAKAIAEHPNAVAVLVNNPTYYGICSDLRAIVRMAHDAGMLCLADEAHGTHFYFGGGLPVSAMAAGADMAAVSMHKSGGSLTQSSLLLTGPNVHAGYVRQIINLTQTTSGSYLLMSSLDISRRNLALRGRQVFHQVADMAEYAREEINAVGGYYAFGKELCNGNSVFDFDTTKLSVHTLDIGLAGIEVYDILRDEYDIQIEFGDIGNILAYVGSSSSATYFPSRVMLSDTESHSIALKVLPAPHFADGEKFAVQQGAGMAVAKTTDAEEAASVVFLKWLTQPENNIAFAVGSGYLPVTHAANEMDAIRSSGLILTGNMENILTQAVDTVNSSEMYTPRAFEGGTKARDTLTYSMSDLAEADRAIVVARIAAGESAADAEAEFMTDEYFEAWYQSLCDALRQYEG